MKIILGEEYKGYQQALDLTELDRMEDRRQDRCLKFGLKSLLHPKHSELFPVNPQVLHNIHIREHFHVNWAKTESYRMSTVPYIQRMLNEYM